MLQTLNAIWYNSGFVCAYQVGHAYLLLILCLPSYPPCSAAIHTKGPAFLHGLSLYFTKIASTHSSFKENVQMTCRLKESPKRHFMHWSTILTGISRYFVANFRNYHLGTGVILKIHSMCIHLAHSSPTIRKWEYICNKVIIKVSLIINW